MHSSDVNMNTWYDAGFSTGGGERRWGHFCACFFTPSAINSMGFATSCPVCGLGLGQGINCTCSCSCCVVMVEGARRFLTPLTEIWPYCRMAIGVLNESEKCAGFIWYLVVLMWYFLGIQACSLLAFSTGMEGCFYSTSSPAFAPNRLRRFTYC